MFHFWSRPRPLQTTRLGIALVIDGDHTFRHFAMRALHRIGCAAIGLRDADEAFTWLERAHASPVLITFDSVLPRAADGFALCASMRAHRIATTTPMLCASSLVERCDRERALESGANMFLPKPVQPDLYIRAAEQLLRLVCADDRAKPAMPSIEWIRSRAM